jgi:S1-C subfamily serine protease
MLVLNRRYLCSSLLIALAAGASAFAAGPHKQQLSAEELFKRVSPSIFSIEIYEGGGLKVRASAVAAMSFLPASAHALTFSAFDKIVQANGTERAHETQWPLLELADGPRYDRERLPTDVVVTNAHILDGTAQDGRHETLCFVRKGKRLIPAQIVELDVKHDLMWLRAENLRAPKIPLRESSTLAPGEKAYAIGAPLGLEASITEGVISGIRHDDSGSIVQTSAAISPGSSGGGLFDSSGNLVGITRYSLRDGQNLNFAVPAEALTYLEESENSVMRRASGLADKKSSDGLNECLNAGAMASDSYRSALSKLCLAYYFFRIGEMTGAEQFTNEALTAYRLPYAHYALGLIFEKAGKTEDARNEFGTAYRMRPNDDLLAKAAEASQATKKK